MGVATIAIEQRYYLGHFREGATFDSAEEYLVDGKHVTAHVTKRVYVGRDEQKQNKFETRRRFEEFELSDSDAAELRRVIERVKNNPAAQSGVEHYARGRFDRQRFAYFYITINGANFEVSRGDAEIAGGLLRILRVEELVSAM